MLNMKEQFKELVVDYFVDSYLEGETPNPCIACNKHMKFSGMLIKALSLEMDYIATGHYARVAYDSKLGRYVLKKAVDLSKDQSYVLYMLNQYQLEHLILPLGDYKKTEVRKIAEEKGLVNARKPDSQDICFVDTGNYVDFIKKYRNIEIPEGTYDKEGNIIGNKGMIHYHWPEKRAGNELFRNVSMSTDKDSKTNTVTLGPADALVSASLPGDELYSI